MPYETIQYPRAASYDLESHTKVGIHWTKDSHVQLMVERYTDLVGTHRPGPQLVEIPCANSSPAAPKDPIPLGSVKVADGQVALKTREAVHGANVGHAAVWTVLRMCGSIEECTGEQIQDWPIVYFGDGTSAPGGIMTDVLDRNEVNRLIRTLRKARDDAYGRDE